MKDYSLFLLLAVVLCVIGCTERTPRQVVTPWGEITDSIPDEGAFDLQQIQVNAELIMLTINGPSTCYEYKGKKLGAHYLLCRKFADKMGVGLRVEICKDTLEMLRRLASGEGDIIAFPVTDAIYNKVKGSLVRCGVTTDTLHTGWLSTSEKPQLVEALNQWYRPRLLDEVKREERYLLSTASVKRRVFAPMLDARRGIISRYDHLFITHAMSIGWDWRLMAAQCYQESTFDPRAHSWAGACGLMQIMPSTADLLGLPLSKIYDPAQNIAAAARYLKMLEGKMSDIRLRSERIRFVLACYNGGYHHVRDAMALARRDGKNPHSWNEVSKYVLLLSQPRYYNDPLVKYGYMRGSETVDYVYRIEQRWKSYRSRR